VNRGLPAFAEATVWQALINEGVFIRDIRAIRG